MPFSMSLETLLAFVAAMFLLSLSPGPGFLMVVARSLAGGLKAGLAAIAGLVVGDILYLVLAILGLSALASVMGELFLAVKVLGAAYLIWLGVKTWCSKPSLPPIACHLLLRLNPNSNLNQPAGGAIPITGLPVFWVTLKM